MPRGDGREKGLGVYAPCQPETTTKSGIAMPHSRLMLRVAFGACFTFNTEVGQPVLGFV